jgi:hypothetical protein
MFRTGAATQVAAPVFYCPRTSHRPGASRKTLPSEMEVT